MGNNSTKEQGAGRNEQRRVPTETARGNGLPTIPPPPPPTIYTSRGGRASRSDLGTFLGLSHTLPDREHTSLEVRKETKQEREARKLEKERVLRARERERSMRDEHVDGGYLVTQGVYTGTEDYNKGIVRQLMIERRFAPFWRGLHEHSESWTENQLVAVARGRPIPAPDAIPDEDLEEHTRSKDSGKTLQQIPSSMDSLTVPIVSRAQSFNSDASPGQSPISVNFASSISESAPGPSSIGSALSRGRAKTIASLTGNSETATNKMIPKEVNLPHDPSVNGIPIEAYLYQKTAECSICLLEYPPFLNKTRCCDQPICSECFVQIKRPDPHPPEHATTVNGRQAPTNGVDTAEPDDELVSESAKCPYCNREDFGVTYEPPPFRRGLTYANHASAHPLNKATSAMSSSSSIASGQSSSDRFSSLNAPLPRRRTTSVSAGDPSVITTDRVRPDWHYKLTTARAHTARRSAAATALHTAAYLMGNRAFEQDGRSFGAFGRRGILRRSSGQEDHYTTHQGDSAEAGAAGRLASSRGAAPRLTSRRGRAEDLEEMMMMEAIRLSLASEEERRKREEKEARRDTKKKEKETKKAEKEARKHHQFLGSQSGSSLDLADNESSRSSGKGKEINTGSLPDNLSGSAVDPQSHLERARQQILPNEVSQCPYMSAPHKPSHLRNLSNASSSTTSMDGSIPPSLQDHIQATDTSSLEFSPHASGTEIPGSSSTQDQYISGTPPGGGAGMEPMFNFRSLAAMVGHDESRTIPEGMNSTGNNTVLGPQYDDCPPTSDRVQIQDTINNMSLVDGEKEM